MKIRIGTRGSQLALIQSNMVAKALGESLGASNVETEIIEIKTSGDKKQGKPLAAFGDKKDWVYELELALLNNEIDIAVHSAKDVPGNIEEETALLPILERANPFDIFIGKKKADGTRIKFKELPKDATIGTASLRRKASLFFYNKKFTIVDHRGNVPTRIKKLDESDTLSGIILARAGVERLGALPENEFEELSEAIMLPAMNQGILCVQFRKNENEEIFKLLSSLSTPLLKNIYFAERAVAAALEGDCNSAISIFAKASEEADQIKLMTRIMSIPLDKQLIHVVNLKSEVSEFTKGFDEAIHELIKQGAKDLI